MQFFRRINAGTNTAVKRVAALTVMMTITVSSVVTVAAATCSAEVDYNGTKKSVTLFSRNTKDILEAAGVDTGKEDRIVRTEEPIPAGAVHITIRSAYRVVINVDGLRWSLLMYHGDTVADALSKAGITLGANDTVTLPLTRALAEDTEIRVGRRVTVLITADGKPKSAVVSAGTVSEALAAADVSLGSEDIVTPAKDTPLTEGLTVRVQRVTYRETESKEAVPYSSVSVKDSSLYSGQKKVKTAGKNGERSVVRRQKLIDGKPAGAAQTVKTTVTAQPVNQVTLIGTKKRAPAVVTASGGVLTDENGKRVAYKRVISGKCTGYTGGGRTATGRAAAYGLIAVDPRVIPYGTRLYVVSPTGRTVYGYAVAADTGGFVFGGRIIADLYFNTESQCRNFGVRTMKIYVL